MFIRKSKLIGQTINGYEILDSHNVRPTGTYLVCKCIYCGEVQERYISHVKRGKARCHCRTAHQTRKDESKTRLYKIYRGMLARTTNKNVYAYKDYGGIGVKVCNSWAEDYNSFKEWALANGYREDLTIDRINPYGDYEPDNCRWVDIKTQARNKRNTVYVEAYGETRTVTEWAEISGIKPGTIKYRLSHGWSNEEAVTKAARRCSPD